MRPAWIEIQYCARRPPGRNIGASLDVRSTSPSVIDSSQIENHSSHHLYQSVFCSHLVIARLAGDNFNAVEKNIRTKTRSTRWPKLTSGRAVRWNCAFSAD